MYLKEENYFDFVHGINTRTAFKKNLYIANCDLRKDITPVSVKTLHLKL